MRITISFDLDWPTADALQFWWFDNGKPMKTYSLTAASREALEERLHSRLQGRKKKINYFTLLKNLLY